MIAPSTRELPPAGGKSTSDQPNGLAEINERGSMNDCIEYGGPFNKDGYGVVGQRLAHRLSWRLFRGVIPQGMTIDHTCQNRRCLNVEHLQLLSREEHGRVTQQRGVVRSYRFNGDEEERERTEAYLAGTECINGHERTAASTYFTPRGKRVCRLCGNASKIRSQARDRAESGY